MAWIIDHIPQWNSWMAVLLYWLPLALCAYGYNVRLVRTYRKELAERAAVDAGKARYYVPTLTVGTIVGGVALTVTPIANLFAAVFDVAPEVFGDFFRAIGRALDIPLVPKRAPKEPTP